MSEENYALWAQRYIEGVAASARYTDLMRKRYASVAVTSRARGAGTRCAIKGCTRHAHKARMCRGHWSMVPYESKVALVVDCMVGQRKTAERHYKTMLRDLRRQIESTA